MRTHTSNIHWWAAFIFVCSPILNYYGYGFITLALLFFLVISLYVYVKRGYIGLTYTLPMICYMLYYCCARVLCNDSPRQMIVPSIIIMFLIWGFFNRELRIDSFLRCYRYVALVCIVFFALQEVMYALSGYRLIGILTILPVTNVGGANFDASSWAQLSSQIDRSSAFFSEPAHFAQFLLPLTAVELFYVANRRAYIRSIFYLITLMLLASGNALLGICVIILFFIVNILKKFHPVIAAFIIILFSLAIVYSVNYILDTEYGEKLMDRQTQIDPDQSVATSGFVRIFRGYYVFDNMNFKEKLIGLNSNDRLNEVIKSCDVAYMFEKDDTYMNAAQSILIHTGFIGCFIFMWLLINLWTGNNIAGRCCIMIFVALSFIASIYFSYVMLLLLITSFMMKRVNIATRLKTIIVP